MRAPRFWQRPPEAPGLVPRLLSPLGRLYALGTARRLRQRAAGAYRAGVPVICLGNLTAGGAGKTPAVIALAERLGQADIGVHVVSRGYGARVTGPVRVSPGRHAAEAVGDEPLLLAAFAPVWVASARARALRAAEAAGAEAILLDDGFQDASVEKDIAVVVADAALGFGNGRMIPAGPLREPVEVGLARADLVLTVGDAAAQAGFAERWGPALAAAGVPQMRGEVAPLATGMAWRGLRALAFAGIAYPEKFFATLRATGADVVRCLPLDDHQPLGPALLARLEAEARAANAQLVTTEKDAVRLPPSFRRKVLTLPVRLQIDDWGPFEALWTARAGSAGSL